MAAFSVWRAFPVAPGFSHFLWKTLCAIASARLQVIDFHQEIEAAQFCSSMAGLALPAVQCASSQFLWTRL
jgi:hypothetical protein